MLTNKKAPWVALARGTQRKHKVGACQSHHVLSIDLTGPFPTCLGKSFCYGLVAVYSMGVGENLPFVQGTRGNSGEECTHAVLRIIKEIMWLSDGALVVRIHSDEGGEFWNNIMEKSPTNLVSSGPELKVMTQRQTGRRRGTLDFSNMTPQ